MNNNGFIIIDKSIKTYGIYDDLELIGLFTYFVLNCEYEEKTKYLKGLEIEVKKGECLYFQKSIAEKFGFSIGKINKMINKLKKIGICENKNTNKYSIIKPINSLISFEVGKQNENKMKTKGNNIKIIKNNNIINNIIIKKDNNIFLDFWNNKKQDNCNFIGDIDNIDFDNINFEDFKKSCNLYFEVLDSKFTFLNFRFTLKQFLNSKKGFLNYLNKNFDDFLDLRKKEEFEIERVKIKRELHFKKMNEIENIEVEKLQNKKNWILNFKKSKIYIDNKNEIMKNILDKNKNANISNSVFLAYENDYICKNFNCPY